MDLGVVLITASELENARALADVMDQLLTELSLDLRLVIVADDPGQALGAHQALGLLIMAQGAPLRRALLAVEMFDRDLPVLLATEPHPQALGEADALSQVYRLRRIIRVTGWPTVADLTGFLFRSGRHGRRGRLIPMSG